VYKIYMVIWILYTFL